LKNIHKKNQIQVGIIGVGNWGKYGQILGLQFGEALPAISAYVINKDKCNFSPVLADGENQI